MSANYFLRFSYTKRKQIDRSKNEEEEKKKKKTNELFLSVHRHQVNASTTIDTIFLEEKKFI